jgi:hypothetical protein
MNFIEMLYVASGLLLPLFYAPQILLCWRDHTLLASYSLTKAFWQLLLRLPVLFFSYLVVDHTAMNIVVTADVLARCLELGCAVLSLRRQGLAGRQVLQRLFTRADVSHVHPTPVAQPDSL